jgi:hypothetical protein
MVTSLVGLLGVSAPRHFYISCGADVALVASGYQSYHANRPASLCRHWAADRSRRLSIIIGSRRATTEERLDLRQCDLSVLVGIDRLEDSGMTCLNFLKG